MELFSVPKNLSEKKHCISNCKNICMPSSKTWFQHQDFIEEQDLETLNMLCGEDCKEYSSIDFVLSTQLELPIKDR